MSTLLSPSLPLTTRRVAFGRSRLVALVVALTAAFEVLLLGPAGVDAECGVMDMLRARALRPGAV